MLYSLRISASSSLRLLLFDTNVNARSYYVLYIMGKSLSIHHLPTSHQPHQQHARSRQHRQLAIIKICFQINKNNCFFGRERKRRKAKRAHCFVNFSSILCTMHGFAFDFDFDERQVNNDYNKYTRETIGLDRTLSMARCAHYALEMSRVWHIFIVFFFSFLHGPAPGAKQK